MSSPQSHPSNFHKYPATVQNLRRVGECCGRSSRRSNLQHRLADLIFVAALQTMFGSPQGGNRLGKIFHGDGDRRGVGVGHRTGGEDGFVGGGGGGVKGRGRGRFRGRGFELTLQWQLWTLGRRRRSKKTGVFPAANIGSRGSLGERKVVESDCFSLQILSVGRDGRSELAGRVELNEEAGGFIGVCVGRHGSLGKEEVVGQGRYDLAADDIRDLRSA
ncbi:uncharacterized protein BCR38DRAFT_160864 [Pseudomassariella vexata]|uniref:Uncharacterized protein n=1 Tax=Pseudomassariella vexata TaxID=1141098 RepID=A0A1Y2E845_9PEZI|nr:uncharacterized protein BCR38DRAFT_160864 [Pseudomassariella vexata]ORY67607.1 hypothetical protein BCR38DRAFT_160864 [Pseudomassariella vexata]